MSLDSYNKALELFNKNKDMCHFAGGRTEELICLSEEAIGYKFSPIYRDFIKKFGAGNFGSQEVYGVIDEDFVNSSVPDAIWYSLTEREKINLPENLLVIYDTGGEELFCLDFSNLNKMNEPKVVSFISGQPLSAQRNETVANDFGDFLLDLVTKEIED
ncbi:SMI1/KNR4 family protein [Paenibacillus durus]|uniref:Cell wall assembly protein n=1 Tax=Paenibacillus durus ATCC 35681 TaxID=1333534 RepID=A0A0F7F897_PAEDU|nr:SMI1/KNR4 family protein [Paenibacillus durus]AKG33934.1 cell wall assembly protein [Paenibacillus durus ATCC 35681]